MKKKLSIILLGLVLPCLLLSIVNCQLSTAHAATIGTWKAYMAYHDVTEIETAGNIMYVLASDGLYTYNKDDNSLQTFDKTNGLSDCAIAHIAWNSQAKRLVIVYKNANIDMMDEKGNVYNLSDYYTKAMTEDKTVYSIDNFGAYAYLSTAFGVMKVNVKDIEISDTYNLGFRVDYTYLEGDYIYAASSSRGLYRGLQTDNLLDKNNWERVGDYTSRNKTIDPEVKELVETLLPGGPKYNNFGFMRLINGKLYTCGGGSAPACIQILDIDKDEWQIYNDEDIKEKTGLKFEDIYCVDVDPLDEKHVFAGSRKGLYEFYDGEFVNHYNDKNSIIETAFAYNPETGKPDREYEIISGLKYDTEGNLWIINAYGADQSLIKYTTNKTFESFDKQDLKRWNAEKFVWNEETNKWEAKNWLRTCTDLREIFTDSKGRMWFGNNSWTAQIVYSYDYKNDKLTTYDYFVNQDGKVLDTNSGLWAFSCVVEDLDGNIWLGANMGPLVLEPSQIDAEDPVVTQVKVPRNDGTNYADYLLDGVNISAIAIDGAGRKWFGTPGNGVYLISRDNYTQLQHFTQENSGLLSDNIESIAINNDTGEVFFGTSNGLCSYMSDVIAPSESMSKNSVWAYPNPVRPDYTGPITITGLTYNADVKIVTTNGVLVAKGRSNGGIFVWDGNDLKGKRVASGIYMVETATETGGKGTVCKVAIVN